MTIRSGGDAAGDATKKTETPDSPRTTPRRHLRLVARLPVAIRFPVLAVLVTAVLGSLSLTGSSVSLDGDNGLIAGRARPLRTDEWFVRTPLVARQAALDLPERDVIGVGDHDMAVGNDLPTGGWEILVRPHTFPYHMFGISRAFAFEWWSVYFALPAIGLYALALALGVRALTASLVALLVVLSPVAQWWTVPMTGTTIGYACLAAAALITAARRNAMTSRVALAVLAGWFISCLVLVLYPPWAVPMALLAGTLAIAAIATTFPSRGAPRAWWLGLLVVGAVASLVAGAIVLAFFISHREAIDALANSIYPGQRRSAGGAGDVAVLLGAPFDIIESTKSNPVVVVNGLNQSEAATGLFTLFGIAAALIVAPRAAATKHRRVVLLAILAVGGLFLVWYLAPVPEAIGHLLLLDRVRSDRMLLPLAAASALALGLFVDVHRRPEPGLPGGALVAGTAAFALPTLWAGWNLEIEGELVRRWQVVLLAAAATAGIGIALSGRRAGLWLLVALFAAGAATINPVQHGVSGLVDGPGATLGRELRSRRDTGTVLNLFSDAERDLTVQAGLTASGVPLVSGVNNYPNAAAWRVIDPGESSRRAWDRYNIAVWAPGPAGSAPRFELSPPATLTVTVDPCDPRLAMLGVSTVVSDNELPHPCLERIPVAAGPRLFAYKVNRPTP